MSAGIGTPISKAASGRYNVALDEKNNMPRTCVPTALAGVVGPAPEPSYF
ncbi:hypothetical protein BN2497_11707 [Janthinobacterium sp. CG23_2]|nr:hypothetical protein [Massilia sp. H27-R4]CUI08465.1 hypothetical protein BN2497_11707 [Janthinobacterium sp. CG23_2]CUU32251.1 hypothetical protein BN3177_11707 [Janthinobacterium sp. CG23_2]